MPRDPISRQRHRGAAVAVVASVLAASCSGAASPAGPGPDSTALPTPTATTSPPAVSATTSAAATTVAGPTTTGVAVPSSVPAPAPGAIVADHTTTDPAAIPAEWRAAARDVIWAYGSTSHGTQLWAGAAHLAERRPELAFAAEWRAVAETLGMRMAYDDGWSWDPDTFADEARALLDEVPEATTFMWSWCGELSDPGTDLDAYLGALEALAAEYPGVTFVAMTGHTDGGSPELAAANGRIRDWVEDTGGALFDVADIERFDPAGGDHPNADDSCRWCADWCNTHPDDCAGLGGVECAHSHPLTCLLKAGAVWWLSARLAGWDGESASSR